MNQLFQLNPALCPLAIAEIKRRCADAQRDYTAFRGLCYQVTVGGQVWHVGNRDSDPSEVCNWTDADFGFSPLVGVNTPMKSKARKVIKTGTTRTGSRNGVACIECEVTYSDGTTETRQFANYAELASAQK